MYAVTYGVNIGSRPKQIRYNRIPLHLSFCYSVKLRFKVILKLLVFKLCVFSVLLHMNMNRYIFRIQKHV